MKELKPLYWLGSSHKDLMEMPEEVKDIFGFALYQTQMGQRHPKAKPFHIPGESGLLEIVESYDGDAYRAIYTINYADAIYVIHCFQKKSVSGIKTPKHHVDMIEERLKRLKSILGSM